MITEKRAEAGDSPVKVKNPRLSDAFHKVKFVSVLRTDLSSKSIFFRCTYEEKDAILILQKIAFTNKSVKELFEKDFSDGFSLKEFQANDIYSRYLMHIPSEKLNEIDVTLICPAEKHHFDKYSSIGKKIIIETPEMYKEKTIPFLNVKPKDLSWVHNILNGTSEVENVLYRDDDPQMGFILVLDYKWNRKTINGLHMLAIVMNTGLTCLRDLDARHLPMLRKIKSECIRVILENFKSVIDEESKVESELHEEDILIFFHYPPTFYHLHVHFTHINSHLDGGTQIGRGHLLHDVIANIEVESNFYKARNMHLNMGEVSPMLKALNAKPEEGNKDEDTKKTE